MKHRQNNGRFARGNPGGPGRPKRPTEISYFVRLSDKMTMERWDKIIDTAITAAENGDKAARQWLSEYLMGAPGTHSLVDVAVRDEFGLTSDVIVEAECRHIEQPTADELTSIAFGLNAERAALHRQLAVVQDWLQPSDE